MYRTYALGTGCLLLARRLILNPGLRPYRQNTQHYDVQVIKHFIIECHMQFNILLKAVHNIDTPIYWRLIQ